MKPTRLPAWIAVCMVCALVLGSCSAPGASSGGTTAGSASSSAAASTSGSAAASTSGSAAASTSGDKIELAYWSMWNENENQAKAIQQWITAFEAANPNITITPTWNGRQNQTLLRNALAAGTKVDLMDQDADQVAGGMMAAGQGYPLNEFLQQQALDEAVPIKDVFVPGALNLFDRDGTTYLWPYVYNTVQFFYNRAVFDEQQIAPPQTWDELLAACQKLTAANVAPIAVESDLQDYSMYYFTYLVARMKGPGFLAQTALDKTGEGWRDPVFLQAAQMGRQLWDQGCIPPESTGYKWPQAQETIASGDTQMELVGSWLPTELASAAGPDFQWGAFPFPAVPGGEGKTTDTFALLLSFMILKDSAHPQEAFEFLKFTTTKENQQIMVDVGQVGVTRKGVTWPQSLANVQETVNTATTVFPEGDGLASSNAEYFTKVLREPHHNMFTGSITPEQLVDTLVSGSKTYWQNR